MSPIVADITNGVRALPLIFDLRPMVAFLPKMTLQITTQFWDSLKQAPSRSALDQIQDAAQPLIGKRNQHQVDIGGHHNPRDTGNCPFGQGIPQSSLQERLILWNLEDRTIAICMKVDMVHRWASRRLLWLPHRTPHFT